MLGGTRFVGRHLVETLVVDGHTVTVFNRGHTPLPLQDVEQLVGDRDTGDLGSLRGRDWDVCLDVNGYLPQHVRASAELLADRVRRYAFISTASVYVIRADRRSREKARCTRCRKQVRPRARPPARWVACEEAVESVFPVGR